MESYQPPQQAKPLSATVEARLNLAKQVHNLTLELHPDGSYELNVRNTLFQALVDLVGEHFAAIIVLVERRQFFGSALALLRPLLESYLRAVWIRSIASDVIVVEISRGANKFPKFYRCQEAVQAYFEEQGVAGLYNMGPSFVRALHGFTHSGIEQIMGRISPSLEITPYNYPDSTIITLLDQAGRFAVMTAMVSVQAIEGSAQVMSPKVVLLQERFQELLQSYGVERQTS